MKFKFTIIGSATITALIIILLFNTVQLNSKTSVKAENKNNLTKDKIVSTSQNNGTWDKPDYIIWNEEKQEYYDSTYLIWDTNCKDYVPRKDVRPKYDQPIGRNYGAEQQEWLDKNKDSKNELDKAIISFRNAMDKKNTLSSVYSKEQMNNNPEYQVFSDLGVYGLKEMKKRIDIEDPFTPIFVRTIAYTTKISTLNDYFSEEPDGIKEWINHYEEVLKKAKGETKTALKDKGKLPEIIKSYGVLTLPYLVDDVKMGNTEAIKYLPQIVDRITKSDAEQLKKYNADDWKKWFEANKNTIEQIRELTESYNN